MFPSLFQEFSSADSAANGEIILSVLEECDLDEDAARVALRRVLRSDPGKRSSSRARVPTKRYEEEESSSSSEGESSSNKSPSKRARGKKRAPVASAAGAVKVVRLDEEEASRETKEDSAGIEDVSEADAEEENDVVTDSLEDGGATPEPRATPDSASAVAAIRDQPLPTTEEACLLEIARLEQELLEPPANYTEPGSADADKPNKATEDEDEDFYWKPPPLCVPINANVLKFDFEAFARAQRELGKGRMFDVILTDPPWQLATANPTRGVALGYHQLHDQFIKDIPFAKLQTDGYLLMFVINSKYRFALQLFEQWGYELVDEITWVKQTVNRRLAKSHGYYLQHAKETCLVGRKGNAQPPNFRPNTSGDVIYSERRGQSQKPTEVYEMIEALVPGGYYLEIFGRRNNTRDGFVTIGNEL